MGPDSEVSEGITCAVSACAASGRDLVDVTFLGALALTRGSGAAAGPSETPALAEVGDSELLGVETAASGALVGTARVGR